MPRAPKENPLRRNARIGPVDLPAEGRKGRTPAWPLTVPATEDERKVWIELWHTPQAVAWETFGWNRTIARYCKLLIAAENTEDGINRDALAEVRQLEDRLGLTPKSMRLMLWRIVENEVAEKRESRKAQPAPAPERPKLRAVDVSAV